MAEKRTIELEIKDNSKSLKAQLKEAQAEVQRLADTYGATSQQAKDAAKRAADLKDRIGDAKALTDAYNPDAKFKAFGAALQGVAGGFEAVTGAMGLMGTESEDVQKAMLRVQSAMAITQGLNQLGEARDSFKNLGGQIKDVAVKLGILTVTKEADAIATTEQTVATSANIAATNAQTASNAAAGTSFKTMGTSAKVSLNGIKGAIAATGIGVLLIALGAMVAYWDDIKAAVSGVSKEQNALIEKEKQGAELAQKKLDGFALEEKAMKLAGKSEQEINKLRQQRLKTALLEQEQYIAAMKQKKKMELEAEKRNFGILKTVARVGVELALVGLRILATPIDAAISTVNSLSEALGFGKVATFNLNKEISKMNESIAGGISKMVFNPDAVKADGDKAIQEAEDKLNTLKGQVLDNELAMKQAKENAAKDNAKTQKDVSQDLTNFLDAQEKDRQARITDAQEKELQELANKFDEMSALADKAGQDTTAITEQYQKDVIAVKQKYKDLELKKQEEANQKAKDLEKKQNEEFLAQIEALDEANYQAKLTEQERELGLIREKYLAMEEMAKGNADAEKTIAIAKGRELADVQKKYDDEEKNRRNEQINKYLDLAKGQFEALGNLAVLFGESSKKNQKKAFNVKKAADIAGATIDTYKAATAAYSSMASIPVVGPVLGGIAASIAVATGIMNVRKIAMQKFEGGGSVSGGSGGGGSIPTMGGGGGTPQAPNFNVVGNNGLNQLAQLQQQPTQAYVVSGEVSSAQSLDRNRIQNATL
jgi:hypothetical protein